MKLRIHVSFERESSGDGVGATGGGGPQHARQVSLCWAGSTGFFSGALSSGAGQTKASLRRGVQGLSQVFWVSQLEKGSCFLFSVSSFTQQNKTKQTTTTNKTQNQAPRCPGHGPAGFPIKPGLLGSPHLPPRQPLLCGDKPQHMRAQPRPPPVSPPPSPLLSPVLHPSCLSAHWRYQKFQIFKAVSVFSVYVGGFIMVRGQKRFSTSHTFKEEKMKITPILKFKRIKSTFFVKNKKKLADVEKFLITGLQ